MDDRLSRVPVVARLQSLEVKARGRPSISLPTDYPCPIETNKVIESGRSGHLALLSEQTSLKLALHVPDDEGYLLLK